MAPTSNTCRSACFPHTSRQDPSPSGALNGCSICRSIFLRSRRRYTHCLKRHIVGPHLSNHYIRTLGITLAPSLKEARNHNILQLTKNDDRSNISVAISPPTVSTTTTQQSVLLHFRARGTTVVPRFNVRCPVFFITAAGWRRETANTLVHL